MRRLEFGLLLLFCCAALAQQPDTDVTPAMKDRELDAYRRILLDWGGLTHYGSEDAELSLHPDPNRVVFLGDEITESWAQSEAGFFPGKPYVNRGIERQTTAQMLVRFRQDVIDLQPKVVVIEAGTNDIASVMGPSTESTIAEHITSMVELAKLHGIAVVLASVPPVCDCPRPMTARRSAVKINSLNRWLKQYAVSSGSVYLDYYSVLAKGRLMNSELTDDGLQPNARGYRLMAPLAEEAIRQAMSTKRIDKLTAGNPL